MAEMAAILRGWLPEMRETHIVIINKFDIYSRNSCQFPLTVVATAEIQTSYFPHTMTTSKKSHPLAIEAGV